MPPSAFYFDLNRFPLSLRCFGSPISEAQPGDTVVCRDIIDHRRFYLMESSGHDNPASDLPCAPSQRIGIKSKQLAQPLPLPCAQLLQDPPVQLFIDPLRARPERIMRKTPPRYKPRPSPAMPLRREPQRAPAHNTAER
jgi:hypothetical protein